VRGADRRGLPTYLCIQRSGFADQFGRPTYWAKSLANAWFDGASDGNSMSGNGCRDMRVTFNIRVAPLIYMRSIFFGEKDLCSPFEMRSVGAEKSSVLGAKVAIEENPMTSVEGTSISRPSASGPPPSTLNTSPRVEFAGKVLRALFLICLIIVTIRVALPQSEKLWTIYDEPGDLVRFGLGLGVCIWIAVHLFKWPTGGQAYQTWFYFGLAGVPFGILCAVFVWWNHVHTWWHQLVG
jgi:hypothetical protein